MALVFPWLLNILGCPDHRRSFSSCRWWLMSLHWGSTNTTEVPTLWAPGRRYFQALDIYYFSIFVLFCFSITSLLTKQWHILTFSHFIWGACVCLSVWVCMCQGTFIEVRGQLVGRSWFSSSTIWVSLPPRGYRLKELKPLGLAAGTFTYETISLVFCFYF